MKRLTVALPWLEAALAPDTPALPRALPLADLEWLVARGVPRAEPGLDWRSWLLAEAGAGLAALRGLSAAACIRSLATGGPADGHWLCARPVHVLTGLDHLRLAPSAGLVLEPVEVAAIAEALQPAFAAVGMTLHATDDVDWLVESERPVEARTMEPAAAAGLDLRDVLPEGPDGRRLRALGNELQMLLHQHPVNLRRAGRGQPTVNSLWLWGAGPLEVRGAAGLPALFTDDAWLAGAWRLLGGRASRTADPWPALAQPTADCIAISRMPEGAAADVGIERALAALRGLLRRGEVDVLVLLLGARPVDVTRAARLRFWRRPRPIAELFR